MTENIPESRMRMINSVILAGKYREEKNIIGGYIAVHSGAVAGVFFSLPEVMASKYPGNPILVDDTGNVYRVEDKKWKQKKVAVTYDQFESVDQKKRLADHIGDVLRVEMLYVYRYAETQINEWFNACRVPLNDNAWRKLEYLKICHAFEAMTIGRTLDSLIIKDQK
jgi:hypothetical protein